MNLSTEVLPESIVVELSPRTAVVFGRVPDGLDLIPFRLIPPKDLGELVAAVNATCSVLDVSERITDGFAEPKGLVQLDPRTLDSWRPLIQPSRSGDYFDKSWHAGTKRSQIRWLPAPQNAPSVVLARLDLAAPMLSIQTRLDAVLKFSRDDVAVADSALEAARPGEWAQLWSQAQDVASALNEVGTGDDVTSVRLDRHLTDSPASSGQMREQFKRRLNAVADEWDDRWPAPELVRFVNANAEEAFLDLHSFLIAHCSRLGYLALRAGRARLGADRDPRDRAWLRRLTSDILKAHTELLDIMRRILSTTDFSRINWHLRKFGEPDYTGPNSDRPEWDLLFRQLEASFRKLANV